MVVNHLPIIFPMVALLVLATGLLVKSNILKRMAFGIFALGAIFAFMAFSTGEKAEDVVENLPGVTENLIHLHEEMAERFALLSYLLGAVSLVALWANWKEKKNSLMLSPAVFILSMVVLFFAKSTGTSGGEIRHTEIRQAAGLENAVGDKKEGQQNENDD